MVSIKRLVFVRHAQSIGNRMTSDERAVCEIANHAYPLTEIGKQQAFITGKFLEGFYPDTCLCSSFLRTKETAEIILKQVFPGVTQTKFFPQTDSRLDEKWDGIFHELSKSDIEKYYPEQIRLRERAGYYHYRAPGGENCPDVEIRIRGFLHDPAWHGKNLLVVGHGRWFTILQKILHNLTVEEFMSLKKRCGQDNCSVTEYQLYCPINDIPHSVTPWKGKLAEQQTELA